MGYSPPSPEVRFKSHCKCFIFIGYHCISDNRYSLHERCISIIVRTVIYLSNNPDTLLCLWSLTNWIYGEQVPLIELDTEDTRILRWTYSKNQIQRIQGYFRVHAHRARYRGYKDTSVDMLIEPDTEDTGILQGACS